MHFSSIVDRSNLQPQTCSTAISVDAFLKQRANMQLKNFGLPYTFLVMCDVLDIYISGSFVLQLYYNEVYDGSDLDVYVKSSCLEVVRDYLSIYGYIQDKYDIQYKYADIIVIRFFNSVLKKEIRINVVGCGDVPESIVNTSYSFHTMNWYHRGHLHIYSPWHLEHRVIEIKHSSTYNYTIVEHEIIARFVHKYELRGFRFINPFKHWTLAWEFQVSHPNIVDLPDVYLETTDCI